MSRFARARGTPLARRNFIKGMAATAAGAPPVQRDFWTAVYQAIGD